MPPKNTVSVHQRAGTTRLQVLTSDKHTAGAQYETEPGYTADVISRRMDAAKRD